MTKIKFHGGSNQGDYLYFIVEKNKHFFKWLKEFLKAAVNYDNWDVDQIEIHPEKDCKMVKKNIAKMKDVHESYANNGSRVDVFYGNDRVFVVINTKRINHKKISDTVDKMSTWKKPKKI